MQQAAFDRAEDACLDGDTDDQHDRRRGRHQAEATALLALVGAVPASAVTNSTALPCRAAPVLLGLSHTCSASAIRQPAAAATASRSQSGCR